jgi:hypothetical protein
MFAVPIFRATLVALAIILTVTGLSLAQKLSAEDILAQHLKSFGSSDAIAKSKNRMAVGHAEFTVLSTQKKANGKAVLASNGSDLALFSTFNLGEYRMERIGLFDNKVTIPFVDQAHRSTLGSFLALYDKVLSGRVFGGSIFSTWALYSPDLSGAKIEADGKKKVGDKDAWVVKITPKGGLSSGSYVRLYFDAKDFHHIRTVYRQPAAERGFYDTSGGNRPGSIGNWDQDMANNGTTLTEDFDDFKNDAAGISLPHKYSVLLSTDTINGTNEFKWVFTIDEYKLVNFPADFFSFQAGISN